LTPEGKGDNELELDFLLVSNQEIWAGECKAGEVLEEKDLTRARTAIDLGIDRFIFVTPATFTDDTTKRIDELSQAVAASRGKKECVLLLNGDGLLVGSVPRKREVRRRFSMMRTAG
jgi:hypothetical protein